MSDNIDKVRLVLLEDDMVAVNPAAFDFIMAANAENARMDKLNADHMARMEARLREQDEFVARCHDIIGEESPGGALTLDQRIAALKAELAAEKQRHANNHTAWTAANEELRDAHQRALNERDAARNNEARLRAALQAVEFFPFDDFWATNCPWCKGNFTAGHAPDCQRQAALAQTSEVKA